MQVARPRRWIEDGAYLIVVPLDVKGAPEKVALAWWVRQHTVVPLRWVSGRLEMSHYSRITEAVSRMSRRPSRKLQKFKRKLAPSLESKN